MSTRSSICTLGPLLLGAAFASSFTSCGLLRSDPDASTEVPGIAPQDPAITTAIGELLAQENAAGRFDGIALVARGEHILFRGAIGRAGSRPIDVDATFRIASITKQMTALLVLQEVSNGRLALDTPLEDLLPDLPNVDARSVTVRQLLQHMSGLANPDVETTDGSVPPFFLRTDPRSDDHQALAYTDCAKPMQRHPGEAFEYNNCDYLVLGAVLERIAGSAMSELFDQRIFERLAMRRTFLATRDRPEPSDALRGLRDDGTPELPQQLPVYGASGAVVSTIDDLLRFDRALLRYELLTREATEQMFRGEEPYFQALGSWSYPITLATRERPLKIVERQGSIGGIRLLNLLSFEDEGPDDDLVVILVATSPGTELFQLYAGKGLPFDLLALVSARH